MTCLQAENSDVLLPESVAVAVAYWPVEIGVANLKVTSPEALVVTFVVPR